MGWVLVKVMGGDEGAHRLRNEIADGSAARNPPANLRGRDIDTARQEAEAAGVFQPGLAASKDNKLDEPAQVVDPAPGVQFGHVVRADQVMQDSIRVPAPDALDGVDGEARAGPLQLGVVEEKARFIGERRRQHLAAHVRGRGGGRKFVRGKSGRDEDHAVQLQGFPGIARQKQVAVMHGIKSAAVKRESDGGDKEKRSGVEKSESLRCAGHMERSSLGQLLLTGVPGLELDPATAAAFRRIQPGGFILFGRNIESPAQLRKLIDDLRELSAVEPIITIDQEGGRVSRLKLIGHEPPNANQLRDKNDLAFIRRHGAITGRLLRMFGFNLDLCPVLDISFDDDADNSLRGRCYGNDVAQVIRNAGAFNEALQGEGILSCGKHFPGYSRAPLDAHHELPEIALSRAELDAHELAVFRHFADKIDSMMIGHGFYPALEGTRTPSSLSHAVITDLLRGEHGFRGLVMTDDLDMGAILNHYGLEETIRLAITAGNDLAMICHRVNVVEEAHGHLAALPTKDLDRALENVARFKAKQAPPEPWSEAEFVRRDLEVRDLRAAVLGAEAAEQRSPEDGKRSPVEIY
jgi:beta-N-acetylhexosaminidase